MRYQYVAVSEESFVQQAVLNFTKGKCFWYVHGTIKPGKEEQTDRKILEMYGIERSKFRKCRDMAKGIIKMQYLRFKNEYLIFASTGRPEKHLTDFWENEKGQIRNIKRNGVTLFGKYHVYQGNKMQVRIPKQEYRGMQEYYLENATLWGKNHLENDLFSNVVSQYDMWGAVRFQMFNLIKKINKKRRSQGLKPIEIWIPVRKNRKVWEVKEVEEQCDTKPVKKRKKEKNLRNFYSLLQSEIDMFFCAAG